MSQSKKKYKDRGESREEVRGQRSGRESRQYIIFFLIGKSQEGKPGKGSRVGEGMRLGEGGDQRSHFLLWL